MSITLNASTSSGFVQSADNSGEIELQSNGTTALKVNTNEGIQILNCLGVGNATPSTSGAGITFPATQSASSDANTLDDYEEGTWTPTLIFAGGSAGQTYSVRTGSYTKIGRVVYATCRITLTNKGSSTGSANVAGLPFTSASGNANYGAGVFGYIENPANGSRWSVQQFPVQDAGTTTLFLRYYSGSATVDHNEASFNNNTDIIIAVTYQV